MLSRKRLFITATVALLGVVASASSSAQEYWEDDPGGLFNPPPVVYNPIYYGYGSYDNITYNKIDMQKRQQHADG